MDRRAPVRPEEPLAMRGSTRGSRSKNSMARERWGRKHGEKNMLDLLDHVICCMPYVVICCILYVIWEKTCYMVFLISETMSIQVRHVPCRFHGKLWEAGASGGSLSPTQLCSGPQQKRQQSHGFLRYRNTHLSSGNVGITGITIIKPPIFLGMVNIPIIYGDDWGMVYCCRTHMNLR